MVSFSFFIYLMDLLNNNLFTPIIFIKFHLFSIIKNLLIKKIRDNEIDMLILTKLTDLLIHLLSKATYLL